MERMGWIYFVFLKKPIFFTVHVLEITIALFYLIVNAHKSTQTNVIFSFQLLIHEDICILMTREIRTTLSCDV